MRTITYFALLCVGLVLASCAEQPNLTQTTVIATPWIGGTTHVRFEVLVTGQDREVHSAPWEDGDMAPSLAVTPTGNDASRVFLVTAYALNRAVPDDDDVETEDIVGVARAEGRFEAEEHMALKLHVFPAATCEGTCAAPTPTDTSLAEFRIFGTCEGTECVAVPGASGNTFEAFIPELRTSVSEEAPITCDPDDCDARPNATAICDEDSECAFQCNDGFGDCDGEHENGCEAEFGSEDHCKECGDTCPQPDGANLLPLCNSSEGEPICAFQCNDNFADLDGDLDNGCETFCDCDPGDTLPSGTVCFQDCKIQCDTELILCPGTTQDDGCQAPELCEEE